MSALPRGIEILDLDDLIESAQTTAFDANEMAGAMKTFVKLALTTAVRGGVMFSKGDVEALVVMLDVLQKRTAAANEAVGVVALARLEGVR